MASRRKSVTQHRFYLFLFTAAGLALYYPWKFSPWANNQSGDSRLHGNTDVLESLVERSLPVPRPLPATTTLKKIEASPSAVLIKSETEPTTKAPQVGKSKKKKKKKTLTTTQTKVTTFEGKTSIAEIAAKKPRAEKSAVKKAKGKGKPPICIHGIAVPKLYLLGQQRAGSTYLLRQLVKMGILFARNMSGAQAVYVDKDTPNLRASGLCHYIPESHRSNETWLGHLVIEDCHTNITNKELSKWLRFNTNKCKSIDLAAGQIFADTSAVNLRLPGLPAALLQLYGANAKQLEFVVALREPLERLQSGYYHTRAFNKTMFSFEEYGKMILDELPSYKARNWVGLASSYKLDQMYRSLYALNLEPWLNTFSGDQFTIFPMKLMKNATFGTASLRQIAKKLSMVDFKIPKLIDVVKQNPHRKLGWQPLSEDLTSETRDGLQTYFDADTRKLSEILAPRIKQGLLLVGYGSQRTEIDDKHVMGFLIESW